MIVYISGPYRAKTEWGVEQNIHRAMDAAAEVWAAGHVAICPHGNTAHMGGLATHDEFIAGDLEIIERCCDAMIMLEGWEDSEGAVIEHDHMNVLDRPIFYGAENFKRWLKKQRAAKR